LLGSLLDVDPAHRCTAPADETINEDAKMELADIAMVVDGMTMEVMNRRMKRLRKRWKKQKQGA